MGKEIGPESAQHRIKQRQADHADGEDMQRREAFMYEHLVDDDLRKERRQQSKQLQKERRDQHLPKKHAILHDGGNEPGEIELQILQDEDSLAS